MNWLKEQFDLLKDFFHTDFSRILWLCAAGLIVSAALGAGAAFAAPELVDETLNSFMAQIEEAGVIDEAGNLSVLSLLTNNWMAMMLSALYGFVPFLFLPLFSLFTNGALLGMLGAMCHISGISLWAYLAGILPHGIFELSALALSIACGVCLCRNMCRLIIRSRKCVPLVELGGDLLRVLLFVVLPLTVAAAVIECYVTPIVMELFV